MSRTAIITDLDGTILPRGGCVSEEVLSALQNIGEKGNVRIIATGRNLYSARQVLADDFPIDYLVFASGAGVMCWHDKKLLSVCHLSEKNAHDIARYLWDFSINFTVQREIPDNHHYYYTEHYPQHADYLRRLETYKTFGIPISTPEDIHGRVTQFVMILDAMQLRLMEDIRLQLSGYSIVRTTSPIDNRAIWLEIFAKGVNKGAACRKLLEMLEIDCANCAGIGNDYNDVDFLDICGHSAVVSNAPVQLKNLYKTVASDRQNGFVEFAIKNLML